MVKNLSSSSFQLWLNSLIHYHAKSHLKWTKKPMSTISLQQSHRQGPETAVSKNYKIGNEIIKQLGWQARNWNKMTNCQVVWLYSNINDRCKFLCNSGYHQCHLYHIPYVSEDSKNYCQVTVRSVLLQLQGTKHNWSCWIDEFLLLVRAFSAPITAIFQTFKWNLYGKIKWPLIYLIFVIT